MFNNISIQFFVFVCVSYDPFETKFPWNQDLGWLPGSSGNPFVSIPHISRVKVMYDHTWPLFMWLLVM